tara:strand:+ start:6187 stop:7116 length:930 start_codon:yes stop_codon:yes gene_type:complete
MFFSVPDNLYAQTEDLEWTTPRTPWGDPDFQGLWTNTTTTPLERPASLEGKQYLTDEERAALDEENAPGIDAAPGVGAYNNFWMEQGYVSKQTSLVVDPQDGKLPPVLKRAQQRQETLLESRRSSSYPTTYEEPSLMERCITRGLPGVMLPGNYNHNYNILQTPDFVVILAEMIHDTRIIPIDGRAHIDSSIDQWMGDSRGYWEDNTLVVETTNFSDKLFERRWSLMVWGTGENMHLVERFTRINETTIDYEFTLTDPTTFSRPFTASIPMTSLDGRMYEYACHEGNYAMANMLRGARADEVAKEQSEQ